MDLDHPRRGSGHQPSTTLDRHGTNITRKLHYPFGGGDIHLSLLNDGVLREHGMYAGNEGAVIDRGGRF